VPTVTPFSRCATPVTRVKRKAQRNGAEQDATAQRSSTGLALTRANRDTDATAAAAGENDASVPIRLLIPTPAQRVSRIRAERMFLQPTAYPALLATGIAFGCNKDLYLTCRGPRRTPPFMFRNKQIWYYENEIDLVDKLTTITALHRRMVL